MPTLFQRIVVHFFVERPASQFTLAEMLMRLQQSTHEIAHSLAGMADTPENCQQLAHVITIERWGQVRLRVALGAPFILDESDGYALPAGRSLPELISEFLAARQDTLEIAQDIQQANPPANLKIHHNQYGPLSVRGWLHYLDEHASQSILKVETRVE